MEILGIRVDNVTMEEAISRIASMIRDGKKHYVVTPNAEFLVDAQKDEEFKRILNNADLSIPDGIGVVFASKFYGKKLVQRVAGTDLVDKLCQKAAERGWSVFFLGGLDGAGERTARILQENYQGLTVSGFYGGRKEPEYDRGAVRKIEEASEGGQTDILFVAYGHRHQEKWIARNLGQLEVSVAVGVGGAFDFISGALPRAPLWVRNIGLEWLYRLIKQPWRWKRILKAVLLFPWLVLKDLT